MQAILSVRQPVPGGHAPSPTDELQLYRLFIIGFEFLLEWGQFAALAAVEGQRVMVSRTGPDVCTVALSSDAGSSCRPQEVPY